jgi:hypothetical protein
MENPISRAQSMRALHKPEEAEALSSAEGGQLLDRLLSFVSERPESNVGRDAVMLSQSPTVVSSTREGQRSAIRSAVASFRSDNAARAHVEAGGEYRREDRTEARRILERELPLIRLDELYSWQNEAMARLHDLAAGRVGIGPGARTIRPETASAPEFGRTVKKLIGAMSLNAVNIAKLESRRRNWRRAVDAGEHAVDLRRQTAAEILGQPLPPLPRATLALADARFMLAGNSPRLRSDLEQARLQMPDSAGLSYWSARYSIMAGEFQRAYQAVLAHRAEPRIRQEIISLLETQQRGDPGNQHPCNYYTYRHILLDDSRLTTLTEELIAIREWRSGVTPDISDADIDAAISSSGSDAASAASVPISEEASDLVLYEDFIEGDDDGADGAGPRDYKRAARARVAAMRQSRRAARAAQAGARKARQEEAETRLEIVQQNAQTAIKAMDSFVWWNRANREMDRGNFASALRSYEICRAHILFYLAQRESQDFDAQNNDDGNYERLVSVGRTVVNYPAVKEHIKRRNAAITLRDLYRIDWIEPLRLPQYSQIFESGSLLVDEMIGGGNEKVREKVDATLLVMGLVFVSLGIAEAARMQRDANRAIKECAKVLSRHSDFRLLSEVIEWPFVKNIRGLALLEKGNAEYKARLAAEQLRTIDDLSVPPGFYFGISGGIPHTWSVSTADPRGLQRVNADDRVAACWFSEQQMGMLIDFPSPPGETTYQIALYCLDWDHNQRTQRVQILEANEDNDIALKYEYELDGFSHGKYIVWTADRRNWIRIINTSPSSNGVFSGIFIDASESTSNISVDTVTRGEWKGRYGAVWHAVKDGILLYQGLAAADTYRGVLDSFIDQGQYVSLLNSGIRRIRARANQLFSGNFYPFFGPAAASQASSVSINDREEIQSLGDQALPFGVLIDDTRLWSSSLGAAPHNSLLSFLLPSGVARADSPIRTIFRGNGRTDAFWIAPDGAIMTAWVSGGEWRYPDTIAPTGSARSGSPLAAIFRPSQLDVFWFGPEGGVARASWSENDGWDYRSTIDDSIPSGIARGDSPICAVSREAGYLDIFWIGPDGGISVASWDVREGWAYRASIDPAVPSGVARSGSPLAAVSRYGNLLDVFWIGTEGEIAWASWSVQGGWSYQTSILPTSSLRADSPLAAVARRQPNLMDVFWIAADGSVSTGSWSEQQGWQYSVNLQGRVPAGSALPGTPLAALAIEREGIDPLLVVAWRAPENTIATAYLSGRWHYQPSLGNAIASSAPPKPSSPLAISEGPIVPASGGGPFGFRPQIHSFWIATDNQPVSTYFVPTVPALIDRPVVRLSPSVIKETNPLVYAILAEAKARLEQIESGLNYLGYSDNYVPPWRFDYLLTRARALANNAKNAERDYLNFLRAAEEEDLRETEAGQVVSSERWSAITDRARVVQACLAALAAKGAAELAEKAAANARSRVFSYEGLDRQIEGLADEIREGRTLREASATAASTVSTAAAGAALAGAAAGAAAGPWGIAIGALVGLTIGLITASQQEEERERQSSVAAKQRQYELENLRAARDEAEKSRSVAQQQATAAAGSVVVNALQSIATALRHHYAQQNLQRLQSRTLNAEQWFRLAALMRIVSEKHLQYAVETAFLAEQAYEFEVDRPLNVIRFDYEQSEQGGWLAADFLLRDLDEIENDLITSQQSRQQTLRYIISLSRDFPDALQQLRQNGQAVLSLSLRFLEQRFPGLFKLRIGSVEVLPIALADPTRLSIRLTHAGSSHVRNSQRVRGRPRIQSWLQHLDNAWPLQIQLASPQTAVYSGLTATDQQLASPLAPNQRNAFEGLGAATSWQVDLSMRENRIDPRSLADLRIVLVLNGYYDDALAAEIRTAIPATTVVTRWISARLEFPDAFYDFHQNGVLRLPVSADRLVYAGNVGRLRNIGFLLTPAAEYGTQFTASGCSFVIDFEISDDGRLDLLREIPELYFSITDLTLNARIVVSNSAQISWDFGRTKDGMAEGEEKSP